MAQFDHEKLDVYGVAIDFVVLANDVAERLPRGRAYVADQLQRAGTSISLNIAEGAGEFSSKEKARFCTLLRGRRARARARARARPCPEHTSMAQAILDVCSRLELAEKDSLDTGRELLLRIVAMLTQIVRRREESGTGSGTGSGTKVRASPEILDQNGETPG